MQEDPHFKSCGWSDLYHLRPLTAGRKMYKALVDDNITMGAAAALAGLVTKASPWMKWKPAE